MNTTYKTSLPALGVETAKAEAKTILENSVQQMGMVPNLYANLANMPGLIATYTSGYNFFRTQSGLSPAEQEVVFLTASRENACTYCTAAHSFAGDVMSNVPAEVTNAIRDGKEIPDAKLKTLSDFTLVMMRKHGKASPEDVAAFMLQDIMTHTFLLLFLRSE
jgi:AhpD family alkylhydroperoxidase